MTTMMKTKGRRMRVVTPVIQKMMLATRRENAHLLMTAWRMMILISLRRIWVSKSKEDKNTDVSKNVRR